MGDLEGIRERQNHIISLICGSFHLKKKKKLTDPENSLTVARGKDGVGGRE